MVITTVVHLLEIIKVLEAGTTLERTRDIVSTIIGSDNVVIVPVDKNSIQSAIYIAERHRIGVNDALAIEVMSENSVTEIYSNDKHFDNYPEITRIWE